MLEGVRANKCQPFTHILVMYKNTIILGQNTPSLEDILHYKIPEIVFLIPGDIIQKKDIYLFKILL